MLSELPLELLTQIVTHLPTAQSLLHLSLTCQRLHEHVERDGWRVFVQSRFPSLSPPAYWKEAAHALTTLSRAWDRKAFIATCIEPPDVAVRLPRGRQPPDYGRRRIQQTMGYQPVIDSYEEWIADDWSSRNEVLAWGAGAQLVVRRTTMGHRAEQMWQSARIAERPGIFDQHHRIVKWLAYKEDEYVEGRDDITSLNLLRPGQRTQYDSSTPEEEIVVGRASGKLDLVVLSAPDEKNSIRHQYLTEGRAVRSASVNTSEHKLVAACLSDTDLALYPLRSGEAEVLPTSQVSVIPKGKPGRTWSTRFLTHDRLAVGLGPSVEPIHVYNIGPDGISSEPLRKFGTVGAEVKLFGDDRVDTTGSTTSGTSSVYPIVPIAASSQAGGREGEIFLSGWYDGVVRYTTLHAPSLVSHERAAINHPIQTPRHALPILLHSNVPRPNRQLLRNLLAPTPRPRTLHRRWRPPRPHEILRPPHARRQILLRRRPRPLLHRHLTQPTSTTSATITITQTSRRQR